MSGGMSLISGVAWVPTGAWKEVPEPEDPDAVQESIRDLRLSEGDAAPTTMNDFEDGEDVWENGLDSADDSDVENEMLKKNDLVCLTAHAADEQSYSAVEVFVYDATTDGLYVHHDIVLEQTPMCVTWVGTHHENSANLSAVGDVQGGVTLWNLDVRNVACPVAWLGGRVGKKGKRLRPDSHTEAVLSIKWNIGASQYLATASADATIKLWDLVTDSCVQTRQRIHTDKVQSIDWSVAEPFLLLSGGFDNTVRIHDCREGDRAIRVDLGACPEQVSWLPTNDHMFVVSLTDGSLCNFDARKTGDGPLARLQAHSANCVFSFNPHIPGLLATGGEDKLIHLWDVRSGNAENIVTHNLGVGEVFGISFHPNQPEILAAGGSADKLLVYTVSSDIAKAGF